ncbi:DUF6308 family protein [Nocardia suismassiliense]|uniref:DUF6308 family protein n=1 Tax=Nocardia suismassiliense TaxID=2077092 RepID=A0ABW6R6T8_9NOCA
MDRRTRPCDHRGDGHRSARIAAHTRRRQRCRSTASLFRQPYLQGECFAGAYFDNWARRSDEANRFTADDLVAVTFLSVRVPPLAARALLDTHADRYAALLAQIGPDRDLADEPQAPTPAWPAWQFGDELRALPRIGRTTASKLLARKRPRLLPIWDTVVAGVFGTRDDHLVPVWAALRRNDNQLSHRLRTIRGVAGLPEEISLLRVLDVIAWMERQA